MRFAVGLGVSVLLHAALVLPWLMNDWAPAQSQKRDQLVIDLLGLVSNRQVEQQQAGQPEPPEPPRERVAAPAPALAKPAVKKETRERSPVLRQTAPSPVQVERPVQEPVQVSPEPTVAAVQPPANGAEEDRVQQTVRARSADPDAIRKYLAGLKKAIQSKLVYPAEAREAGYVGAPMIRFTLTESGEILPGSLAVQKSSGYPMLDESAMRAALAGAPFDRSPRQMEVAIAVAFARERD